MSVKTKRVGGWRSRRSAFTDGGRREMVTTTSLCRPGSLAVIFRRGLLALVLGDVRSGFTPSSWNSL